MLLVLALGVAAAAPSAQAATLNGAVTWTTGTSVAVSGNGIHTLLFRSSDAIGDREPDQTATVKIESSAPVTTDDSDPGYVWFNHDVTVHFTATDADSGVDYTEYSLDGTTWVRATEVTILSDSLAHTTDGEHVILYRSADTLGHLESARSCTVRIDTQGPATKALARAGVRKGRKATLKYRIDEQPFPCGPSATVTIKIKNRAGKVVKTLDLGPQTVNKDQQATFKCTLKVARYRFWIYAVDFAGNPQQTIGKGYLKVR